jgi:hypothetical protein
VSVVGRMKAIPAIIYALDPDVRTWFTRQLVDPDPIDYVYMLSQYISAGKRNGWWNNVSEMWVHGSKNWTGNLTGLKGFAGEDTWTFVGTGVTFVPRFGIVGDPNLSGYIKSDFAPLDFPGVSQNSAGLVQRITSNEQGSFQSAGSVGTGGAQSFMVRGSTAFRGGIWLFAAQVLVGGSVAEGFIGGVRESSNSGFTIKNQTVEGFQLISGTPTISPFTIGSAEPSASNSPQTFIMTAILKGTMTRDQLLAFSVDTDQWLVNLGVYDDIHVEPEVLGPSCWDPSIINVIQPSDLRVWQQANYPANDTIHRGNYIFAPNTDAIFRSFTNTNKDKIALGANPIQASIGSNLVNVTLAAHTLTTDDVIKLTNVPAGAGIPDTELNGWHRVVVDVSSSVVQIQVTTPATSNLNFGGTGIIFDGIGTDLATSSYTIPRNGVFWAFQWSSRGERDDVGGPITSAIVKPNDCTPKFNRETGDYVGVQCRPAFTVKQFAMGELCVIAAWLCGYLDRNDPDDAKGFGYLDIAEEFGLDPNKVKPWWWFAVNRETVFTVPLTGFAACYDYVILPPKKLSDCAFPRKGIIMDQEHADKRRPDEWENAIKRWASICKCKGIQSATIGHYMRGDTANNQGFTPGPDGNAPRIYNYPDLDYPHLVSANSPGEDFIGLMDAQVEYLKDADGNVPYDKIVLSATLGLGESLISNENAELLQTWYSGKGIKNIHVRRSASQQGGPLHKPWNQLMVRYFPEIPGDGGEIEAIWRDSVVASGGTVSNARSVLISDFLQALIDAEIWDELDCMFVIGENQIQSLKCLRRNVNWVLAGSPLPTFVANRHFIFDGTQNYLKTSFTPSTQWKAISGTNLSLAAYETSNVSSNGITIGCNDNLTTQNMRLVNRNSTNFISAYLNSDELKIANADSRRLCIAEREEDTYILARDGVDLGLPVPTISGAVRTTREIYVGAANNVGSATGFRACQVAFAAAFRRLGTVKRPAFTTAVNTLLTAIGANV